MRIKFMKEVCECIKKEYPHLHIDFEVKDDSYIFYIQDIFVTLKESDLSDLDFDFTPEDMAEVVMSEYEFLLNKLENIK